MGVARRQDNLEIVHARNRMAVACKACGIDCIDTPYTDYSDQAGYDADTRYAKAIGMTGRAIIHPSLIDVTRTIFTPTDEEIREAREIVQAYERCVSEGRGACSLSGKMIDAPIADRARQVLKKAAPDT
jgi:citrate lyase subunit beta/citryl-CoA lyase